MTVTVTDMFCGAGGSSLGAELAGGTLRLGLNHWKRAIETHATNFGHADHDCEDVSSLTTAQIRRYPDSDILLASPECVNHSLAKGARRRKTRAPSFFDDGPANDDEQDRSRATMWDVVRFCEQMLVRGRPYKAVVVENVVDAYKWGYDDDGGLFRAWLTAMDALGYRHEVVWLNSMFCPPTPQSRDRMYVVFWQRGMRSPDLRVEPPSWCPRCERVVGGRQTFKKADRPAWGRYGQQYYYSCPECRPAGQAVLPGVFPAASIIDRSLPAEKIGERKRPLAKNTRERIRRGLARLASEPFAVRLLHGQAPRPLTLPLVTATARQDLAMIMPVAGNTYETTPGNRAKAASRGPLATVHGSLDRAVVVPYSTQGEPKPDDRAPVDTLTRLTKAEDLALVYANRNNGVMRPAAEGPAQSLCTGGHLAVVVSNYGGRSMGWARRAGESPMGSVTTQDGHSLVVPYYGTGKAVEGGRRPAPTMSTRDRVALVVPAGGSWAEAAAIEHEPPPTQTATESRGVVITDEDIDGCAFRMFALHEIAGAMAMSEHVTGGEYVVVGNKRERMAQYGNAVTPPAMELLVSRILSILDEPGQA